MNKISKYISFLALFLVLVGSTIAVSTTPYPDDVELDKVRCDEGKWNSDVCRDFELQDEFDQVEDYLQSLENENDAQWTYIWDGRNQVRVLQRDLHKLQQKVRDNYKLDDMQWKQIRYLDHEMWVHQNQIDDVRDYIAENEGKWSTDRNGISMDKVKNYLYGTFMDYLRGIFAPLETTNDLQKQIYELKAMLVLGDNYAPSDFVKEVARQKALHTGEKTYFDGGVCYPQFEGGMCISSTL